MTKTDWTAGEVRAVAKDVVESISCVDPLFKARDMLTAYAERIEADESAVPVAWMRRTIRHKRIGGREEGERVMSASKVYPDDEPLFTRPLAQPSQEQPGWKVPDCGAEIVCRLTAAMREADESFQRIGGSTRHHVRDCLLPSLGKHGLCVYTIASPTPPKEN